MNNAELMLGRHVHGGLVTDGVFRAPQCGRRLILRVELETCSAVESQVTKEASLIATPAEHGERHRNRNVYADLAHVHLGLELACSRARLSEDTCTIAITVCVDNGNGIVKCVRL
jgi:hypothetical protein